jgi:hypothetical protein
MCVCVCVCVHVHAYVHVGACFVASDWAGHISHALNFLVPVPSS